MTPGDREPGAHRASPRDVGSGTVLVLAVAAVAIAIAVAAGTLGQAAVARHRAAAGADLTALAAASSPGWPSCDLAAESAVLNHVRLVGCAVQPDGTVLVDVDVDLAVPGAARWFSGASARGRARAGPAP